MPPLGESFILTHSLLKYTYGNFRGISVSLLPDSSKSAITLPNLGVGSLFLHPQFFCKDEKRLTKTQKSLSKKQKGAKIHAKIADRRQDFVHKLTTNRIRENQVISLERIVIIRFRVLVASTAVITMDYVIHDDDDRICIVF